MKTGFEYVKIFTGSKNNAIDFDIDINKDKANHSVWVAGAALTILALLLTGRIEFLDISKNNFYIGTQTTIFLIGLLLMLSISCTIIVVLCTNEILTIQRLQKTFSLKQEWGFLQDSNSELSFMINEDNSIDPKTESLYIKLLYEDLYNLKYLDENDRMNFKKYEKKENRLSKWVKYTFVIQIMLFMIAIMLLFLCGIYNFK